MFYYWPSFLGPRFWAFCFFESLSLGVLSWILVPGIPVSGVRVLGVMFTGRGRRILLVLVILEVLSCLGSRRPLCGLRLPRFLYSLSQVIAWVGRFKGISWEGLCGRSRIYFYASKTGLATRRGRGVAGKRGINRALYLWGYRSEQGGGIAERKYSKWT